jgi:hypothetical protein
MKVYEVWNDIRIPFKVKVFSSREKAKRWISEQKDGDYIYSIIEVVIDG